MNITSCAISLHLPPPAFRSEDPRGSATTTATTTSTYSTRHRHNSFASSSHYGSGQLSAIVGTGGLPRCVVNVSAGSRAPRPWPPEGTVTLPGFDSLVNFPGFSQKKKSGLGSTSDDRRR